MKKRFLLILILGFLGFFSTISIFGDIKIEKSVLWEIPFFHARFPIFYTKDMIFLVPNSKPYEIVGFDYKTGSQKVKFDIYEKQDFYVTYNDKVFCTKRGDNFLYYLNKNKMKGFINLGKNIHIYEIYSFLDNQPILILNGNDGLICYDDNGKKLWEISRTKDNYKKFVGFSKNRKFIYINCQKSFCIYNWEGKKVNEYSEGNLTIEFSKELLNGNLIASDWSSKVFFILDNNGNLIKKINAQSLGLSKIITENFIFINNDLILSGIKGNIPVILRISPTGKILWEHDFSGEYENYDVYVYNVNNKVVFELYYPGMMGQDMDYKLGTINFDGKNLKIGKSIYYESKVYYNNELYFYMNFQAKSNPLEQPDNYMYKFVDINNFKKISDKKISLLHDYFQPPNIVKSKYAIDYIGKYYYLVKYTTKTF